MSTAAAPKGELRRAARGGLAFSAGFFASAIMQFAFVLLAAHFLFQSSMGALLEALALFTICNTALGADAGLLRFGPIFRSRRRQDMRRLYAVALVPTFVGSSILAALVFVYAPNLVDVFFHHARTAQTTTVLRIFACFMPLSALLTVACAGLRTWTNRAAVLIQSFFLPIGRFVLLAALVVVGLTLKLAALAYALPIAAGFAVAVVALAPRIETSARGASGRPASYTGIAGEFWRFSVPVLFGSMFFYLIASLDVLLVGAFLSTRLAAAYAVAGRYLVAGTFALQAIIQSISPQVSRLVDAGEWGSVETVYRSATWWSMAIGWPPLLVLAVFSHMFQAAFGAGYVVAASALTITALAMLVNTGTGPNGAIIVMAGRSGVTFAVAAIGLAINVGLNVLLLPHIGLRGAALAWLATIVVTAVIANVFLWRSFRIHPFGHGYVIVAGAALGCFGALGLVTRLVFGARLEAFLPFAVVSCALYGFIIFRWRASLHLDAFESLYAKLPLRVRSQPQHLKVSARQAPSPRSHA